MGNLVIVALPAKDDPICKISSEKTPHMTLLFLGDAETNPNVNEIFSFVHHAVSVNEHGPFMLEIDHRDILGEDRADVVHFRKDWSFKWIAQFRSQLLQNTDIRAAYDSTEQFPEWRPHLTLGYPETPANESDDDRMPHWITFDRIAVWTGDYEGPWFRLEVPERELQEVGWSSVVVAGQKAVDDILHFGVKGMRWGQRKTETITTSSGGTKLVTPKKAAKVDAKWERNQFTLSKGIERHNAMADHVNSRIGALNDRYEKDDFSKEDWDTPAKWSPKFKQYNKEYNDLVDQGFRNAVKEVHGTSPTGKKKAVVETRGDSLQVVIKDVDAKHAAISDSDEVFLFRITRNAQGLITKVEPVEESMEQTADLGEEFVAHVGVKGMKWGVHKDRKGRGRLDPKDHSLKVDLAKAGLVPVPGYGLPATVRLGKRGVTSTKAYLEKRKSPEEVAKRAERKAARKDFYWELHAYSSLSHADVHNRVADEIDTKVYRLQTAPKYRGKSLKTDKKLAEEYEQDVAKVTDAAYRRAVKDVYGANPSGTKEARYVDDARGPRIEIRDRKSGKVLSERELNPIEKDLDEGDSLGHAAMDSDPDITISVKLDAKGFISQMGRVKEDDDDDSLAQTALAGSEFLEHYGIKGMRWGKRKPPPAPVTPTATSKVPHGTKKKTKVKAEGGENHPASEDAIKVAQAKVKLQKSGTAALSNAELREVATRLQLEQQVKQMTQSGGRKFVSNILKTQGQSEINTAFNTNRQIRTQSKMRKAQPA